MPEPISRREFAGVVMAGSLAVAPAATHCAAEESKPKGTAQPAPVQPVAAAVDLFVDLVREKYPHERLDAAALEEIRVDFRYFIARSRTLSSFPLTNADEPGFGFAAWRADRKGSAD